MITDTDPDMQARVRQSRGCRAGLIGLAGNTVLAGLKLSIGLLTGSLAVMADAFNNLADSLSSLVTLAGFQLSGKAKDEKHPYGYGRMEYVSGFVVSLLILFTAFSLGKAAMARLFAEAPPAASWPFLLALSASAAVKLGLAWYMWTENRSLDSPALRAAFKDNLADAGVTVVAVASLVLAPRTTLPVDALAGLLVVGLIACSGLSTLGENLDFLLGKGPDEQLTAQVLATVLAHGVFVGVDAFELHDYGPESRLASLRVVLRDSADRREAEQAMRDIAETLRRQCRIEARLYLEPAPDPAYPPQAAGSSVPEEAGRADSSGSREQASSPASFPGWMLPALAEWPGHIPARVHNHMFDVVLMLHPRGRRRRIFRS